MPRPRGEVSGATRASPSSAALRWAPAFWVKFSSVQVSPDRYSTSCRWGRPPVRCIACGTASWAGCERDDGGAAASTRSGHQLATHRHLAAVCCCGRHEQAEVHLAAQLGALVSEALDDAPKHLHMGTIEGVRWRSKGLDRHLREARLQSGASPTLFVFSSSAMLIGACWTWLQWRRWIGRSREAHCLRRRRCRGACAGASSSSHSSKLAALSATLPRLGPVCVSKYVTGRLGPWQDGCGLSQRSP